MRASKPAQRLAELTKEISARRKEMRELQRAIPPEEVSDYELATRDGTVRLSSLFGDKADLIVIHNMGAGCPYCTLWADGFNGVLAHLENRAAFVLATPDAPATQEKFKASRGWRFRMVSHQGTSFAADMGYKTAKGFQPGVSIFRRDGEKLMRVNTTDFGPGDEFCALWHFFDLLPNGADGWQPRFNYA
jgi:predicted dithiol-disulfide oxidoreductase (DUF899 family)